MIINTLRVVTPFLRNYIVVIVTTFYPKNTKKRNFREVLTFFNVSRLCYLLTFFNFLVRMICVYLWCRN